MDFKIFRDKVYDNFVQMQTKDMFVTDTNKDEIWEVYLSSFPEGSNLIFRERTEHDCNCCKQFIRAVGNVVTISDGLKSIWDVEVGGHYQVVADAMASYVKSKEVKNAFITNETKFGTKSSHEMREGDRVHTWNHFYVELDKGSSSYCRTDVNVKLSETLSKKTVFQGGLEKITVEAVDDVLSLINDNLIYRGQEFKKSLEDFRIHLTNCKNSSDTQKNFYVWNNIRTADNSVLIKNTVIGTLLVDISEGIDQESAVKSFESKVAPTNYKRPKALITKRMVEEAEKFVKDEGIESALQRRYAKLDDITINNVIYADRSVKEAKGIFDELKDESVKSSSVKGTTPISADDFIHGVIPNASSIEMFADGKFKSNMFSLIAPADSEAKNILKWGNNFSWAYVGDVTDSIKERVKSAGGNVNGEIRVSLGWHNSDDLDIHVIEPGGERIHFGNKRSRYTGGTLDVDMNAGGRMNSIDPVENVCYNKISDLKPGKYIVLVNQYNKRGTADVGFTVEFEIDGKTRTYVCDRSLQTNDDVMVVEFEYLNGEVKIVKEHLQENTRPFKLWDINMNSFVKVDAISYSPNYWDDNKIGNKHYFFTLEGCKNSEDIRGLYNEFLNNDYQPHRKVFEVLGNKLRVPRSDEQLSGIGISSTKKEKAIFKVNKDGSTKIYEVSFGG